MKLNAGMPAPAKNAGMNASAPSIGISPWRSQLNSSRRNRQKYVRQAMFSRMYIGAKMSTRIVAVIAKPVYGSYWYPSHSATPSSRRAG